jgi:hypothetical protein
MAAKHGGWSRWRAGLALIATALGTATPARAEAPEPLVEYAITPNGIRVTVQGNGRDMPLPDCEPKAITRDGARVYVACGASGVLLLDATNPQAPALSMRVPTDGDAVAFHTINGKVWVELAHIDARPIDPLVHNARATAAVEAEGPARAMPAQAQPATPLPVRPSLVAPPRQTGIWELGLGTHLFLPIGNIGFGALGNASVAYRLDIPLALHAELAPMGVAGGKQGTIGTAAGHAIVALDTHLFEAGLGFGSATLNDPSGSESSSLSFAQRARIGARDGLALFIRSTIVVDRDRFEVGEFAVSGQARLAPQWWFLVRGGGGPIGFAYGDIGVRYLVSGDLGPGSFFLVGTAGGAGIFKDRACPDIGPCSYLSADYAGPALGLGLEWRL